MRSPPVYDRIAASVNESVHHISQSLKRLILQKLKSSKFPKGHHHFGDREQITCRMKTETGTHRENEKKFDENCSERKNTRKKHSVENA